MTITLFIFNITYCNRFLAQIKSLKMNLSNTEYCRICNSNNEQLVHLIASCDRFKKFLE